MVFGRENTSILFVFENRFRCSFFVFSILDRSKILMIVIDFHVTNIMNFVPVGSWLLNGIWGSFMLVYQPQFNHLNNKPPSARIIHHNTIILIGPITPEFLSIDPYILEGI